MKRLIGLLLMSVCMLLNYNLYAGDEGVCYNNTQCTCSDSICKHTDGNGGNGSCSAASDCQCVDGNCEAKPVQQDMSEGFITEANKCGVLENNLSTLTISGDTSINCNNKDTLNIQKGSKGALTIKIIENTAAPYQLSLYNVAFDDVYVGAGLGELLFYEVNFKTKPESGVFTGATVMSCLKCGFESGRFTMFGRSTLLGGFVDGASEGSLNCQSAFNSIHIVTTEFKNPGSKPYVLVGLADKLDLSASQFKLKNNVPAVELESVQGKQVAMIANNKYIASSGGLSLTKIIKAPTGSDSKKLQAPVIELLKENESTYDIRIKNSFGTNLWPKTGTGSFHCTGTAHGRHVNFEPYYVKYSGSSIKGLYPIGIYGYKVVGEKKYISMKKKVNIAELGKTKNEIELTSGSKITMLVHCEGVSTGANFSNIIALQSTEPPAECGADSDCVGEQKCVEGECVLEGPPVGACESSDDCGEGMVCSPDGQCIQGSLDDECSQDSDCGSGEYCQLNENVCVGCTDIKSVYRMCKGYEDTFMPTQASECPDGKSPVCPPGTTEVEACGYQCACDQEGYYKIDNKKCWNAESMSPCPSGYKLDIEAITCVPGDTVSCDDGYEWSDEEQKCVLKFDVVTPISKGGGGCSLIR